MRQHSILFAALITSLSLTLVGCGSSVERVDVTEEHALTDRWNSTDSRLVAEEMVADMLTFPWVAKFKLNNPEQAPTITIQHITNKSHEHIAIDTFVNDIKRAVIRSGRADFIVSSEERERVREELKQQDVYASEQSRVEMGQESGANFALSGSINSIVDQLEGKRVTAYQVDLKLIDMKSTREVWNGQKKIQKVFERSSFGL